MESSLIPPDLIYYLYFFLPLKDARSVGRSCKQCWNLYLYYLSKEREDVFCFSCALRTIESYDRNEIYSPGSLSLGIKKTLVVPIVFSAKVSAFLLFKYKRRMKEYDSLELPNHARDLIFLWMRQPSASFRMVPPQILRHYLSEARAVGAEFVPIFKIISIPYARAFVDIHQDVWNTSKRAFVDIHQDVWNTSKNMIDSGEELICFSRYDRHRFLFVQYDAEIYVLNTTPPFGLCTKCKTSTNTCGMCNRYYINYEKFVEDDMTRTTTESGDNNATFIQGSFASVLSLAMSGNYVGVRTMRRVEKL